MKYKANYIWKQVPFVRLILPFIIGIIVQYYLQITLPVLALTFLASIIIFLIFFFATDRVRFAFGWMQGLSIEAIFFAVGAILTFKKDITHNSQWIGNYYTDSSALIVTLEEPLVEKTKSYKALASVEAININGSWVHAEGNILVYFRKENAPPHLDYGSQIIFTKPLQDISNSGNPGAFNYQRYCAFQDIYHQVFLTQDEYHATRTFKINSFWRWLFDMRISVIKTLQQFITPQREAGVAEALLIGYRDDLDKDLVQAYSNTGVVHIIAISGLHLGLIYGMLVWFFKRFKQRRWIKWVKPVVILAVLWIFTLIAGAAPSILRSAVMFSCIVAGEIIDRKSSIYNTLASSAFIILCYNPFFLWDVGFQLSYAAVISIVTFMKPIYSWLYVKNKLLDNIWQLNAVTLSAQILTLPFILFHFHQFPNFFLITNFVAVPLSGFILYGELLLLIFTKLTVIATFFGKACSIMLLFMDGFIERINAVPYAIYNNIQMNIIEAILLCIFIIAISYSLMRKYKPTVFVGLISLLLMILLHVREILDRDDQQRIVVYNIPQHTVIDFIEGDKFFSLEDTAIHYDNFVQNFHLKPARSIFRVQHSDNLPALNTNYPFISFHHESLLVVDQPLKFKSEQKIKLDAIILSKNPRIYINDLTQSFDCKQIVADASNPFWKIKLWKKDCDSLHLRFHSTAEKGAFEVDLNKHL